MDTRMDTKMMSYIVDGCRRLSRLSFAESLIYVGFSEIWRGLSVGVGGLVIDMGNNGEISYMLHYKSFSALVFLNYSPIETRMDLKRQ